MGLPVPSAPCLPLPCALSPTATLTEADTDGPDHDAAQKYSGSHGDTPSDQHHHPVIEADTGRAAELSPAGKGQGCTWWQGTECPGAAATIPLPGSDPKSLPPGLVHTGTQEKNPGQQPGLREPLQPSEMQPFRTKREVKESFKINQKWFLPVSLAKAVRACSKTGLFAARRSGCSCPCVHSYSTGTLTGTGAGSGSTSQPGHWPSCP